MTQFVDGPALLFILPLHAITAHVVIAYSSYIELANAYRDAEELRGEGDAEAASVYANAYQRDPEFYSFVRSLNAYKSAFASKADIMLLEPDSDFFKYLNKQDVQ